MQRSLIPRSAAGTWLPSPAPSKRWYHLQAQAFKRDACQGMTRQGRPCQARRRLQVHHVDGDVTRNVAVNLLTLCGPCHIRAHGKQTWPNNNRRLRGR